MTKRKGVKPEESIPQPKKPQPTSQQFIAEYQALCKRTGFQLIGQPVMKPMNDLGGYLTVIQMVIVPYQEQPPQG